MADDDALIGAKKVRQLLDDCSEMQIWRLLNDPRYERLAFPRPIKINIRNYWRRREILEWIKQRPTVAANYGRTAKRAEAEALQAPSPYSP